LNGLNRIGDLDQLTGGGFRVGKGSGFSEFHLPKRSLKTKKINNPTNKMTAQPKLSVGFPREYSFWLAIPAKM
jgi:hypothetical protein